MITIGQTDSGHPCPNKYFISRGTNPYDTKYLTLKGEWERSCLNGYYNTREEAEAMLRMNGLTIYKLKDETVVDSFDLGGAL